MTPNAPHDQTKIVEPDQPTDNHNYTLEARLKDSNGTRSWFHIISIEKNQQNKTTLLKIASTLAEEIDQLNGKTLKLNEVQDVSSKNFWDSNIPHKQKHRIKNAIEGGKH